MIQQGDSAELHGKLDRFKTELRAGGLSESTVHQYLTGARLFVRWLDGDYTPGRNRAHRAAAERQAKPAFEQPLQSNALSLEFRERRVLELRRGAHGEAPLSRGEIAAVFGMTSTHVAEIEKTALKKLASDRNAAIAVARQQGKTLQEIGDRFGMSRERVRQIVADQPAPPATTQGAPDI